VKDAEAVDKMAAAAETTRRFSEDENSANIPRNKTTRESQYRDSVVVDSSSEEQRLADECLSRDVKYNKRMARTA
jgi:hypothetical protein